MPFFVATLAAFRRVYDQGQRSPQFNLGLVLMDWQDKAGSAALTLYDHRVLANLKLAPEMAHGFADFEAMVAAGRKGNFEQEARALPDLKKLILPRD